MFYSDYEDRLALYSQSIWSCQCTGRSGLTHQEAWMSETKIRIAMESSVVEGLRRPILNLVHHSTSTLDELVDCGAAMLHSQFYVGEELALTHSPL